MGSGRQKGGVTCTWLCSRPFLGLAELQGALPQAGFSTTVLSLLPWLGVKELTGHMRDTCFPCQLDGGGQTRVGRGPLSIGTDFCPQKQPGHIRTQGERTSLSHPTGHGSSILPGVICKGTNPWAGRESGGWLDCPSMDPLGPTRAHKKYPVWHGGRHVPGATTLPAVAT